MRLGFSITRMRALIVASLTIFGSFSVSGTNQPNLLFSENSKADVYLIGGLSCLGMNGVYGRIPTETDLFKSAMAEITNLDQSQSVRVLISCFSDLSTVIFSNAAGSEIVSMRESEFELYLASMINNSTAKAHVIGYSFGGITAMRSLKFVEDHRKVNLITIDGVDSANCGPAQFFTHKALEVFNVSVDTHQSIMIGCQNYSETYGKVLSVIRDNIASWNNFYQRNYMPLGGTAFAAADRNQQIEITSPELDAHRDIDGNKAIWLSFANELKSSLDSYAQR